MDNIKKINIYEVEASIILTDKQNRDFTFDVGDDILIITNETLTNAVSIGDVEERHVVYGHVSNFEPGVHVELNITAQFVKANKMIFREIFIKMKK